YYVQPVAELPSACHRKIPVFAIPVEFIQPGADRHFQTFELTVDDKVRHPAERIRAISRRCTAGDDVNRTHQRRRKVVDVYLAALVGRRYTRTVEQDQCAVATE